MKRARAAGTRLADDWRESPCRKCRIRVMVWWRFCPACGQQLPSVLDGKDQA